MILTMLISALMQGMLYAPMALGVFIAFGILDTPDLTIDGSLVFGMTVCAAVTISGHPILALVAGSIAGAVAGAITGIFQTKFSINPVLSGILTMTGLYSVNYAILGGQSNRYLQDAANQSCNTVYKMFLSFCEQIAGEGKNVDTNVSALIITVLIVILVTIGLAVFFKSRTGMAIRATGDNEEMVRSSSIDSDKTRIIGIMITNALVGFSGALLCQQQKYADLNCGSGMLVVGLASVIIGQVLFGKRGITLGLIEAVVGSSLYRIVIQIAYKIDMPSYMVKIISAVIVALALAIPKIREKYKESKSKKMRVGLVNVIKEETP